MIIDQVVKSAGEQAPHTVDLAAVILPPLTIAGLPTITSTNVRGRRESRRQRHWGGDHGDALPAALSNRVVGGSVG